MSQPDSPSDSPASPSLPLKERAFTLACQGLRSPAIAHELGIPERTARAWIQELRTEATEERKAARRTDLTLAIERQFAISAAAWQGFERAARAERQAVALLERPTGIDEPVPLVRFTAAGARYLTVAQAANREAARLQDLYGMPDEPEEPQQLPFLVINAPRTYPDDLSPEDRAAWDAFMAWRRAHRPDDPTPFTYPPRPASPSPTTDAAPTSSDAPPSAPVTSVVKSSPSLPETEKPAETANAPAEPTDVRDLPGIKTYPPDLTNPAPVTPQLRRHLAQGSEIVYMPAPAPTARQRTGRRAYPPRGPRLGVPPSRR